MLIQHCITALIYNELTIKALVFLIFIMRAPTIVRSIKALNQNWDSVFMREVLVFWFIVFFSSTLLANNNNDSANVNSNEIPALTLEDCLLIGIEENLELKNERIDVRQSEIRQEMYDRSIYFPDIDTRARLSNVSRPGEEPRINQSASIFTNFTIFDMEIGPQRRKRKNWIKLSEYGVTSETADLQRDIAVAYIRANLVKTQQDISLDQLLLLDSLKDLSVDTVGRDYSEETIVALNRLRENISPLQEMVKTQLKALETNYDDRIGQLNNLMSLDNDHNFKLADPLSMSYNNVQDEKEFIQRLIDRTIEIRTTDDELRKLNLQEDMKMVNAAFFPELDAGVSYEEDFMTNFKGFSVNVLMRYNVYDPNARKRKDLARLDIEQINNSILQNKRDMERWIRGYYNKSKEFSSQVRPELIQAQQDLYESNLEEFLQGKTAAVSATDVINSLKDYFEARENYFSNIANSEIQKVQIRFFLMDFITPFSELGRAKLAANE